MSRTVFAQIDSYVSSQTSGIGSVGHRCPACFRESTFVSIQEAKDVHIKDGGQDRLVAQRKCSAPDCHAWVVFTAIKEGSGWVIEGSYPPEPMVIDVEGVPPSLLATTQEAATNFTNGGVRSAAIMIRAALEELCVEFNAQGGNLAAKLNSLANRLVLPSGFKQGMQNLRLLGNDAIHINADYYQEVTEKEVKLAFKILKTLLQAAYEQQSIIDELESLKK